MEAVLHWSPLSMLFGLSLVASFALFSALAAARYPTAYGPFHNNTVSQLGNPYLNPRGANWYLIGCAVAGMFGIAFALSLTPWRLTGTQRQNRLLLLLQICGVLGGLGLIMNAVYPEDHLMAHHFWSGVVFNSMGLGMVLAPFALWRRGSSNLHLALFAVLSDVALIAMFILSAHHWAEWPAASLLLLAPAVLGFRTRNMVVRLRDSRHLRRA